MNNSIWENKRIIILSIFLVLLVLILLNRWDIWWDVERNMVFQYDRLTALTNIGQLQSGGIVRVHYQKEFLTHIATAIHYIAIGGVVIALHRESKK